MTEADVDESLWQQVDREMPDTIRRPTTSTSVIIPGVVLLLIYGLVIYCLSAMPSMPVQPCFVLSRHNTPYSAWHSSEDTPASHSPAPISTAYCAPTTHQALRISPINLVNRYLARLFLAATTPTNRRSWGQWLRHQDRILCLIQPITGLNSARIAIKHYAYQGIDQ